MSPDLLFWFALVLKMAVTAGFVAIAVAAVTAFGPEARGVKFGQGHFKFNRG